MEQNKNFLENKTLILIVILLVVLTFATSYYGSTDTGDYADSAKYFSGDYSAKIRNSHSYLFGIIHAPLLMVFPSFIWFKITSIIFIILIILSVYFISGKNKYALWLMILSPVIWYMAPWINPIQMASLCLLWAFYFIKKYDKSEGKLNLVYSGILIGLGWAVWNTIFFFGLILAITYLHDKKIADLFYFCLALVIGLIPLLLLDQFLFGFAFYSLIKTTGSNFFATLFGGIYANSGSASKIIRVLLIVLVIPFSFWMSYVKKYSNKKELMFVTLSLLIILINPQIRYILALIPIMILIIVGNMNYKQFKLQIILSIIVSLVFISPYIIQIGTGFQGEYFGKDITSMLENPNYDLSAKPSTTISDDLEKIADEFPDKSFIVGNSPDDYQTLAHYYWGSKVKEFVSVQDYQLYLDNKTQIFEKKVTIVPRISERRQILISGSIIKNENDKTNYSSIEYGLSIGEPLKLDGFNIVKKYNLIYLSKKVN